MDITSFPCDFFLEIQNNEHLLARITLNKYKQEYFVELAIVQRETQKIVRHVQTLYHFNDSRDALDQGVFKMGEFLRSFK